MVVFSFDMQREKERTWKDVLLPERANPFYSGSEVLGNYDRQTIDIEDRLATSFKKPLNYGIGLSYNIVDFSRLKDPRSRSSVVNYTIKPSLVYSFGGGSSIGISGFYNRRKEKISNISTVGSNVSLMYHTFSGLDNETVILNGFNGYQREWVMHRFGVEAQYGFVSNGFKTLNQVGISRGAEEVYGLYKYEPGRFVEYNYSLASINRFISKGFIHELDLKANYREGYADEFSEQLNQTNNASTGVTSYVYEKLFTYKKCYQVSNFDVDVRYRANKTGDNVVIAYAGIGANYNMWRTKHILPFSKQRNEMLDAKLEFGASLLKRNVLWLEAFVGGMWNV